MILKMPDFIRELTLTQEQLDTYKLPLISDLTTSDGELNDRMSGMLDAQYGFTRQKRLALIEEIRAVTLKDIQALVPVLEDRLAQSGLAIITNAGEMAGHEDEFDALIKMP